MDIPSDRAGQPARASRLLCRDVRIEKRLLDFKRADILQRHTLSMNCPFYTVSWEAIYHWLEADRRWWLAVAVVVGVVVAGQIIKASSV